MKGRSMKPIPIFVIAATMAVGVIGAMTFSAGGADDESSPIFGVKIPPGYRDWRLISVAHEEGKLNDLRAILGNDIAIKAYPEGKLPFPARHNHCPARRELHPARGEQKSFCPPPIFGGRARHERSVYGQG